MSTDAAYGDCVKRAGGHHVDSGFRRSLPTLAAVIAIAILAGCGSLPGGAPSNTPVTQSTPTSLPTPTAPEPTPSPTAPADQGYHVVLPAGGVPVPIPDGDAQGHIVYASYAITEATVKVDGTTVELTLSDLCPTFGQGSHCMDGPFVWTGSRKGDQAIVQDPDVPRSWVTLTFSGSEVTLTSPSAKCSLSDGASGTPVDESDSHYYCQ